MNAIPDVSDRPVSDLLSLKGRVAVVTGGARGLGKAIVNRLAEAGADVVIGDLAEDLAREVAADISARHGARVIGVKLDVTDSKSVAAVADSTVEQFGGINIWVSNAGVFPSKLATEMDDDTWNHVYDVNVRGAFVGAREAARRMKEGEPNVIINIVSTAGFKGVAPGLSAYVSSKHAVRGMTKQLALELAPNIRVLGVAPTFCATEGNLEVLNSLSKDQIANTQIGAMFNSRLGRIGATDDIARTVLFCASDMSIFLTGSTLLADGGETI